MPTRRSILVALGGNFPGSWGTPPETLRRAFEELAKRGVTVEAVSPFYATEAVGPAGQPPYVNAAAKVQTSLPPQALLRTLKQIEAEAGRRGGKPWGPRSLDIDIIDYKGLVTHGPRAAKRYTRAGRRPLVLPHPLAHLRPFVLRPLLDVAPDWRHPSLKRSGRDLLRTLKDGGGGQILKRL
ncbi:MAG TPA: 2-amino-4-hydroxy-6-hydroxymethyldihydropteridine diphosphokinase [Methyloceanibacter sp.]|nr:2-amino-4-hydroxy-6-hydroxymethyldihydropteridine diphosphokinase [Methyloceanibacter sp.]HYH70154.1 2-amino-4-hydroxy-6-hydroxymethyldihydropteridine diphosphokinase [Methyloceanibacter sp.]